MDTYICVYVAACAYNRNNLAKEKSEATAAASGGLSSCYFFIKKSQRAVAAAEGRWKPRERDGGQ